MQGFLQEEIEKDLNSVLPAPEIHRRGLFRRAGRFTGPRLSKRDSQNCAWEPEPEDHMKRPTPGRKRALVFLVKRLLIFTLREKFTSV